MFYAEATYQFDQGDYVESEGSGNAIVVNVQQIVSSVHDVHLLLVPLTYDQYSARAATDPTLAAIDVYHGSRPDPAERKTSILTCNYFFLDWCMVLNQSHHHAPYI